MIPQPWKIERYLLGELPESEMTALKALESENAEFRDQIERLKKDNIDLLAKYPYLHARSLRLYYSIAAALIITVTVMITLFSTADQPVVIAEDGTRTKGLKSGLEIWRKTAESSEKLANNSEANAGDLLQVRYIAEKKCYGVIVSIDGNGVLTIHLSGNNGKAAELEAGKAISLENAYELDDAPKFETFYFITDSSQFALAPIAEGLLHGKLPKNLRVEQISLLKKTR